MHDRLEGNDVHAYEIEDRPGVRLCVGRPPGRERPALWMESYDMPPLVLAQFHGEREALIVVNFLDTLIGQIGRVIKYYADKNGGETA